MSTPPAGWYPDPQYPQHVQRFWDGQAWTNHTAPALPSSGSAVPTSAQFYGLEARPYYRQHFARFDALFRSEEEARAATPMSWRPEVRSWNWAAFLFGVLWYLFRGLWLKAGLLLLVGLFLGFLTHEIAAGIIVGFAAGSSANYDAYRLHRWGKQW